jgi:hypothetical protein
MAQEIQHFTATVPAGTALASPVTIQIPTQTRVVTQIDWRVPNGPMGVFGWQIAMGGVKVFPTGGDTYVVADGNSGSWPVANAPDSGAWQVIGYNTGANPHSVYLVFHCDPVERPKPAAVAADPLLFMPAADLSKAGPPVRGH